MQTIYKQPFSNRIQVFNADPVFCNQAVFVPVLNAEPFALMDCPEDFSTNIVH